MSGAYVRTTHINTLLGGKLSKTGGEMTGPILYDDDVKQDLSNCLVTKETVSSMISDVVDNLDTLNGLVNALGDDANLITTMNTKLDKIEAGTGLDVSGDYVKNTDAVYISEATSLNNADVKLDTAISELDSAYQAADSQLSQSITDLSNNTTLLVSSLQDGQDAILAELGELDGSRIDTLDASMSEVFNDVSALDTAYKAADTTINTSISGLDASMSAVFNDVSELDTAYKAADTTINTSITDLDNSVVKLTGDQSISGTKTLTGTVNFNGYSNFNNPVYVQNSLVFGGDSNDGQMIWNESDDSLRFRAGDNNESQTGGFYFSSTAGDTLAHFHINEAIFYKNIIASQKLSTPNIQDVEGSIQSLWSNIVKLNENQSIYDTKTFYGTLATTNISNIETAILDLESADTTINSSIADLDASMSAVFIDVSALDTAVTQLQTDLASDTFDKLLVTSTNGDSNDGFIQLDSTIDNVDQAKLSFNGTNLQVVIDGNTYNLNMTQVV